MFGSFCLAVAKAGPGKNVFDSLASGPLELELSFQTLPPSCQTKAADQRLSSLAQSLSCPDLRSIRHLVDSGPTRFVEDPTEERRCLSVETLVGRSLSSSTCH
jgi:hypothetical protein